MPHAQPGTDELVGRRIDDRFEILRLIARGSMGRVYEAEQIGLGRRVAVKLLDVRSQRQDARQWETRFHREAASLATLTSPYTVRVIEHGHWHGLTYLVMELVVGVPLTKLLREGPLGEERSIRLALQLCDSLAEAHAQGLVHRDLKPSNVLVTRSADGRERLKVVDWGLVKDLRSHEEPTSAGMLLGTPSYMAPEQIRGEPTDARIDVYAMGVVLFGMLTGRKPFQRKTTTAGVLLTHLLQPPTRLAEVLPASSFVEPLDLIVQRCLAKDKGQRYPHVADLAADLEAVLRQMGTEISATGAFVEVPTAMSLDAPAQPRIQRSRRTWVFALLLPLIVGAAALAWRASDLWSPPAVHVAGRLVGDVTWTADQPYVLDDIVFVEEGTLTLQPGVTVLGRQGSALVITTSARLRAQGRPDAPIVFTSDRPEGRRAAGDWGGLVLLGRAPVNLTDASIEGLPDTVPGAYGGPDTQSNCGALEYVRVEFAGFEAWADNELNGLTLGGCGSRTIVRHVQVHRTLDDGVELFGGTVDLANVVVTVPGDDGLDWDLGWTGRAQFLVIQLGDEGGDNAIEADNRADQPDATPRSAPVLSHVTLVGSRAPGVAQRGIALRGGTAGVLQNLLVADFRQDALDVGDRATAEQARLGTLRMGPAVLHRIGADGTTWFPTEDDDDGGLDEGLWARTTVGVDPKLLSGEGVRRFVPQPGSVLSKGATPLPDEEFWDPGATWIGAIRPGAQRTWMDGWTSFAER
ncbi:MAG: serine/threonine protein kinase [Myxococcales bacterium]|nr:serine/threonine protein kinase [Myxococcales bacterium]